jgi:pimeloyl-ACP methyl ester carboxylesterase
MLAWALSLFELGELALLAALVVTAVAHGVAVALAVCLALGAALAWRAALVLGTALAGGSGWRGWRQWADETLAFTLSYLAMTVEPLRAALEGRLRGSASHSSAPHPHASPDGPPAALVLLHGWCCNAGVWRPLCSAWRRHGGVRPIAVTLTPMLGDLDVMAENLGRRLAPLVAARQPFLLAAHSMGGLVARRWLQLDAEAARLAIGLVTVGTPHAGTRLARFGPGCAAAQMRPGSRWLAELGRKEPPCPVLCVWSDVDTFVVPAAAAVLPQADSQAFAGRGHFGMLRDPRLAPLLAGRLAQGTAPRAAPAAALPAGAR